MAEQVYTPQEKGIISVRKGLEQHLAELKIFRTTRAPEVYTARGFTTSLIISNPYREDIEESSGDEYNIGKKGRAEVSVKVLFDASKDFPGMVRAILSRTLTNPISGAPNEARRALELHEVLRRYMDTKGRFTDLDHTRQGYPQRRYLFTPSTEQVL